MSDPLPYYAHDWESGFTVSPSLAQSLTAPLCWRLKSAMQLRLWFHDDENETMSTNQMCPALLFLESIAGINGKSKAHGLFSSDVSEFYGLFDRPAPPHPATPHPTPSSPYAPQHHLHVINCQRTLTSCTPTTPTSPLNPCAASSCGHPTCHPPGRPTLCGSLGMIFV